MQRQEGKRQPGDPRGISATAPTKFYMSPAQFVRTAEADVCPQYIPVAQTVTYIVTGSSADVTYGPAGTDLNGTVPMTVSAPLGTPAYYAISAQLNGGGQVSCEIRVDGQVISSASASGGHNIASCEIGQDPLTGKWQNDN